MKKLIVNSDDYGRSANVSKGVREAHLNGIVSSTTSMMNLPTTADDLRIAMHETPELGLGVHLVLTAGSPMLPAEQVPSLIDSSGLFNKLPVLTEKLSEINPNEVKAEWATQIEAFVKVTGKNPTHLDSHHHSSYYTEGMFKAMLELAAKYDCPIRLPKAFGSRDDWAGLPASVIGPIREYGPRLLNEFRIPVADAFYASFYDEKATQEEILGILSNLPEEGIFEVMCHPGYTDAELNASTVYARQREIELKILTSSEVRAAIDENNIELVTFDSVSQKA